MKNAILLLFCLAQFYFVQAQITNGLVAYYPLDGNANEVSSGCNNGTNNGALSTFNSCNKPNTAMSFNGTSNYIEVADCPNLHVAQGLSVCAWVKPKAFYADANQGNYIVSRGVDYSSGGFALTYHDGVADSNLDPTNERFNFGLGGMSGHPFNIAGVKGTTVVQLNVWYFVVGTFNGTQMKIYVNAIEEGTNNLLANIAINTDNLLIGKHKYPNFEYWINGDIDEVRIYNRALTPSEIQILYNQNCWATEIETPINNPFTLFPNPAQGKFSLQLAEGENAQVEMFDMQGKLVLSQKVSEKESDFEVSSFAKGLYVLRVTNDKGVFTKKMLLE